MAVRPTIERNDSARSSERRGDGGQADDRKERQRYAEPQKHEYDHRQKLSVHGGFAGQRPFQNGPDNEHDRFDAYRSDRKKDERGYEARKCVNNVRN